eukprot:TRINITY_DN4366_c2_g1_i1.p1 TRINITY_DN4366_c2_g1~~TRINITY_DN4366_c2_g1_i1.p1  ORF type:complete len:160 (-),score=23.59 TRINITY_DN4366_c2_g1_i1:758-1237(-)
MVPSVAHSSNPGGTSLVSSSLSWASSGPRAIPAFGLHIGCILATWTLSTKFVFQFSFNLLDQQGEKTVTSHESDFPFDPFCFFYDGRKDHKGELPLLHGLRLELHERIFGTAEGRIDNLIEFVEASGIRFPRLCHGICPQKPWKSLIFSVQIQWLLHER